MLKLIFFSSEIKKKLDNQDLKNQNNKKNPKKIRKNQKSKKI